MKKFAILVIVILLFAGCSKEPKTIKAEKAFSEEISRIYSIEEIKGKKIFTDLSQENILNVLESMKQNEKFVENLNISFGKETQGVGIDENCERIPFCNKLSVTFTFNGGKDELKAFADELEKLDGRVMVSGGVEFKDKVLVDEKAKTEIKVVLSFLGNLTSSKSSKTGVSVKKNAGNVKEEENIVLRDFDVNMTLRPSNSDAASVAVNLAGGGSSFVCSDENKKENVTIDFTKDGSKYYAEYSIEGFTSYKGEISPKGNVVFDILSCKKVLDDDDISVNLTINNSCGKKVSTVIYNDPAKRVDVVSKSENVEVSRK